MKRYVVCFISIVIAVLISTVSWADERKKVAVLPFSIHSSEDINYVRGGIWDMLISRLSASGKMDVTDKHKISEALKGAGKQDLTGADVYGLGKTIDVDYVVWGSITKIGNSISLDGKLMDVATYKTPVGVFEQCQGMDEVIPKLSVFSEKINGHILGIVPTVSLPSAGETVVRQPARSTLPSGLQAEDALKSQEGTFTSMINPEFISGIGPLDRKGFWMSKRIPGKFKGMDIGDVNNDGLNEVVVIENNNITVYQKVDRDFKILNKIHGRAYDNYLSVDVADINGNGIDEIIVTNVTGNNQINSFILEYKQKQYIKIASNLKWFLRVINSNSVHPLLLGQEKWIDVPYSTPIYEIGWKGEKYREIRKAKLPQGLSVYGVTVEKIGAGRTERVLALDESDHINIYKKTSKPLSKIHIVGGSSELIWKSQGVFGGTNNMFDVNMGGDGRKSSDDGGEEKLYVNIRILTYDINKDGKKEIIIVKNLAPGGRMFKNVRLFTRSEIYNLEWDGLGLVQNWKTKTIQGYVADYQFKDIDNDGENEVVLAIRTSMKRSVIVAYDLNI